MPVFTFVFPDAYFFSEKRFPEAVIDEVELNDEQVGLVLALVPVEEDMREKVRSRPMGMILRPAR